MTFLVVENGPLGGGMTAKFQYLSEQCREIDAELKRKQKALPWRLAMAVGFVLAALYFDGAISAFLWFAAVSAVLFVLLSEIDLLLTQQRLHSTALQRYMVSED